MSTHKSEEAPERYPFEPGYHPIHRLPRAVYDFLASARLAMLLLATILTCCLAGVTIYREKQAFELIFGTLWFNAILVLLIINVSCCFFGRIWRRKVTIVSFGMILFHLSFVAMFLGILYNSLFYFRGVMRLSEGETVINSDPKSYDSIGMGRFFNLARLKGSTTLVQMHRDYKVGGEDKRVAYEIVVADGINANKGIIYITNNLDYHGVTYLPEKEGYAVAIAMTDREGKDIYGAVLPLQGLKIGDEAFMYTTGSSKGPGGLLFPQGEVQPLYDLQVEYFPSKLMQRSGEVAFEVRPLPAKGEKRAEKPVAVGKATIGVPVDIGTHLFVAREVRYWVGMGVLYEPGKQLVLTSLWVGLAGMIITTLGRMFRTR